MVDAFPGLSHLKTEFEEREKRRINENWKHHGSKQRTVIIELPALNLDEGTAHDLTECLEDWVLLWRKLDEANIRVCGMLSADVSTISKAKGILEGRGKENRPKISFDGLFTSAGELHHRMMNRWIAARHGWPGKCGMQVPIFSR